MPTVSTQTAETACLRDVSSRRKASRLRLALSLAAGAGIALILFEAYRVLIGYNGHVVLPGQVYRSAQPGADDLRAAVKAYGLRTVFNLRGPCKGLDFYDEEVAACTELGVAHEDFEFSAVRLPDVKQLRRFVTALEQAEQPILLHCKRGSDRTGLASVIAAVLIGGVPYEQAKGQLSLRYAHLAFGPTRQMSAFFAIYEGWLAKHGHEHSRERLRHWLLEEYRGGALHYEREAVIPLQAENKVGMPLGFRVRYRNTTDFAWHFKPHRSSGIHGIWAVGNWRYEPHDAIFGRAGLFERVVEPGQTVELTYVLPAFKKPGKYQIYLDLVEERHAHFTQVGATALEEEIVVRE
jgi:protein tyrosine phosphatase (PTP) superfamily phosphohydrolase (DUF442 family)